jgi:hypothetical protein
MEHSMREVLRAEGLAVFSEVDVVTELVQGIVSVSQSNGMASIAEFIQRQIASAEVVFMGLATPEEGEAAVYAQRLENLAGDLPTVFL